MAKRLRALLASLLLIVSLHAVPAAAQAPAPPAPTPAPSTADALKGLEAARAAAGGRDRLDPYARSLVEHTTEATEREISWLDRLLDAERARSAPSPARSGAAGHEHPVITIADTQGDTP